VVSEYVTERQKVHFTQIADALEHTTRYFADCCYRAVDGIYGRLLHEVLLMAISMIHLIDRDVVYHK